MSGCDNVILIDKMKISSDFKMHLNMASTHKMIMFGENYTNDIIFILLHFKQILFTLRYYNVKQIKINRRSKHN